MRLKWGSQLFPMKDSTDLFVNHEWIALRQRLDKEGFVLVRGVLSRDRVWSARMRMLSHLKTLGAILPETDLADAARIESKDFKQGWTIYATSGALDTGAEVESNEPWKAVGTSKELRRVYAGEELFNFYSQLFQGKVASGHLSLPEAKSSRESKAETTVIHPLEDNTWLRAKGKGEVTAEHVDYFHFRNHSKIFSQNRWKPPAKEGLKGGEVPLVCVVCQRQDPQDRLLICDLCDRAFHMHHLVPELKTKPDQKEGDFHCYDCANLPLPVYTCWIPLGQVRHSNGSLAVCPGTHTLKGYERPKAGEELPREWEKKRASMSWQTANMDPGDIILFNVKTIHAALANTAPTYRLSCDTRVVVGGIRGYTGSASASASASA